MGIQGIEDGPVPVVSSAGVLDDHGGTYHLFLTLGALSILVTSSGRSSPPPSTDPTLISFSSCLPSGTGEPRSSTVVEDLVDAIRDVRRRWWRAEGGRRCVFLKARGGIVGHVMAEDDSVDGCVVVSRQASQSQRSRLHNLDSYGTI